MSASERPPDPLLDERVLILVKGARDAELTSQLLVRDGLSALVCPTMTAVCECVREGAACVVVAEEMLTRATVDELAAVLAAQPAWSDLPIVLFSAIARTSPYDLARALELGNVVVLDRPIHVRSMLASVRAAVRSRRRQYEARRAINARDMFLAMLGHELRNPLAAIRMALAVLDRTWPSGTPKEIAIAERQSVHLTRLVDDLLDVARVTHGKMVLNRTTLDLVNVVRNTFETFEPRARARGLMCALHAPNVAIWVDGDRARLDQVFSNLLSNAIKYTPAGGKVTVEVEADAERAVVTVADTGIGLAPEMVERIFDVFAQADVSLDRSQGGIGIGLSLARSLLRLHDGDVDAVSAGLTRGATFRVHLPRLSAASASGPTEEAATVERRGHGRRIVVVEDNEDVRDLIQELLEEVGHEVTCAADGPHGVERILAFGPDIAFVDLGLPEFDGLELARRVRAAGSVVRLVALTGYGQDTDKQLAAEAGFDDHLTKPVGLADVERAILRAGL